MPTNQPLSLPPLDSSLIESLRGLAESLALSEHTVVELAWAAFHRNWDVAMLEAWARAKKSVGDGLRNPTGSERRLARIDAMSPWAYAELGLRNGVLPGRAVLGEGGWGEIDGRPVSLRSFSRKAKRVLREQAARYPNGTLAKELAALEAERGRARLLMALTTGLVRPRVFLSKPAMSRHCSRRLRRTRRAHRAAPRTRARGGADPPEPEPPSFPNSETCTLGRGVLGRLPERSLSRGSERGRS